jgi:hypothetical protein
MISGTDRAGGFSSLQREGKPGTDVIQAAVKVAMKYADTIHNCCSESGPKPEHHELRVVSP